MLLKQRLLVILAVLAVGSTTALCVPPAPSASTVRQRNTLPVTSAQIHLVHARLGNAHRRKRHRLAAIHRRKLARQRALHRAHLLALIRQAQASIVAAQAAIAPSGGFWACVANAEEGGRNDPNHGYFGFMGPPSAFGSSGTWLSLSFSEQVSIAESVLAASGPGAWGPLTREKCGF